MLGDIHNKVATAQAVTVTAVSASSIDRFARSDIGAGSKIGMAFRTTTTATPFKGANVAVAFTDANDLVTLVAHALPIGTPVVFSAITTTTGITAGTVYYVSFSDNTTADIFVLSATLAGAHAGTGIVALTTDGTGTMNVVSTVEFQIVASDSNLLAETTHKLQVLGTSGPIKVRIPYRVTFTNATEIVNQVDHGYNVGAPVFITVGGGGVIPTGLVAGQTYHVIPVTADTYQLALTEKLALAGVAVAFSTDGTAPLSITHRDGLLSAGGPIVHVRANPREDVGRRYLGARIVATPALAAGAFDAQIAMDEALDPKFYPGAFEV